MRREGRMHGSWVRDSKHAEWPPVKAPTKPTNHSRMTGKCLSNRVRCKLCCAGVPCTKSKDKTKGCFKAKAFNITSNYKMQEWRVCDSSSPPSSSKKPMLKVEKSFAAWDHYTDLDYASDSEVEDNSDQEDGSEYHEQESSSWNSGIVLPVESLLRLRKAPEAKTESVSDNPEESTDSDDSWSGVDFSGGEEFSDGEDGGDDWFLVQEEL